MARNIWEGLGAGIIGAGNAIGNAIASMPTKEDLEKLALAKRYQEAQIKNLDANNARLEAAARGEQAKAEMDLGIKKANAARMAELSPLLAEYPGLRGAPSGEGRYSQLSDSIKPQIDSSAFGITPKTGVGLPGENSYDISRFGKQATGAMELSPELSEMRSEDIRKAGLARLSPQQLAFKTGAAGSSLPADIEVSKNLTKMQSDEDEYAKEQRRREEFGQDLEVRRMNAGKQDPISLLRAELLNKQLEKENKLPKLSQNTISTMSELQNFPTMLSRLAKTIKENPDVMGPITGRLQSALGKAGFTGETTLRAQNLEQTYQAVKQVVAKAMEGGVLRKEDEPKYDKIVGSIMLSPEAAEQAITQLGDMLAQDYNNKLNAYAEQGFDTSGFKPMKINGGQKEKGLPTVTDQTGYDALPFGAEYIGSDGKRRRK